MFSLVTMSLKGMCAHAEVESFDITTNSWTAGERVWKLKQDDGLPHAFNIKPLAFSWRKWYPEYVTFNLVCCCMIHLSCSGCWCLAFCICDPGKRDFGSCVLLCTSTISYKASQLGARSHRILLQLELDFCIYFSSDIVFKHVFMFNYSL